MGFRYFKSKIIDAQSMGDDIVSEVVETSRYKNFGVQLRFSDGAVGEIFLQASQDLTTWTNLVFSDQILITNTEGSHLIQFEQFPYGYVRCVFVRTSGSGTLTAWFSGKGG